MPSRPDLSFAGLGDSVYKTKVSETETSISKTSKDIVEKSKTIRPSAPIIEEWDTDSDNDSVFRPKSDQTKPKFTKINFVKSGENVKSVNKENTHRQVECPMKNQSHRDNRRNWNGMMTQKLGNSFEFIKKACFVCGSFNHTIKDCSRFSDQKVEKEGQKIGKEAKPKNSRDETLQDCDFAELDVDNAMENVEGDVETQGRNTAEQTTTAEDTVNTASIDVSAAGPSNVSTIDPSTSTAGDIFEDKMMTIVDTLVAIRSTRPTTTSVVICDVEEEPRRATPIPTVQSQ
ncbi:hypothetical protein Tco_1573364, partial [Tanacetum coccineum]